jgi:magnesium chelatase accessory protein
MLGIPVMGKPDWSREGRDWPNRSASRFLLAGGLRWHAQVMGSGPTLLLLHGSGAATHSWRDLAPLLASDFRVVAPDLPGHGFTQTPDGAGLSLQGMARAVAALLAALQVEPALIVGHSAGAAIALRLRLGQPAGAAGGVVSLNGALRPFPGAAGHIFPALARLLFLNPLAIQMFAWRAGQPGAVERLIKSTGSTIDAAGLDQYGRLLRTTGHIDGALGMMAHWDLVPLQADLPAVPGPVTLVATGRDRAVPPEVAREAQARMPGARLIELPDLGHLAHEEAPERIAAIIRDAATTAATAA